MTTIKRSKQYSSKIQQFGINGHNHDLLLLALMFQNDEEFRKNLSNFVWNQSQKLVQK